MQVWGPGEGSLSAGCEYMGGTRWSGIVSSAANVLGIRGVGGMCIVGEGVRE